MRWAQQIFGKGVVLTSSFDGDSAVMLHMVTRIIPSIPVIFIDTGEKPPVDLREDMAKYFNLNLLVSKANGVAKKSKALNAMLQSLGTKAWISGVRSNQTTFRSTLETVTVRSDGIYKVHPILKWSDDDIGSYFKRWNIPFRPSRENCFGKMECGIHTHCH